MLQAHDDGGARRNLQVLGARRMLVLYLWGRAMAVAVRSWDNHLRRKNAGQQADDYLGGHADMDAPLHH